jgi:hypothetical protein
MFVERRAHAAALRRSAMSHRRMTNITPEPRDCLLTTTIQLLPALPLPRISPGRHLPLVQS